MASADQTHGKRRNSVSAFRGRRTSVGATTTTQAPLGVTVSDVDVISYYCSIYDSEVDVAEAQNAAASRLAILELIDELVPPKYENDWAALQFLKVDTNLREELFLKNMALKHGSFHDLDRIARMDRIGFFILGLALGAQNSDLRGWLVKQERRLFLLRLHMLKRELNLGDILGHLEANSSEPLTYTEIPFNEMNSPAYGLGSAKISISQIGIGGPGLETTLGHFWGFSSYKDLDRHHQRVYKLSAFHPACHELINGRRCYMAKGEIYISRILMPVIILERFTKMMNQTLDEFSMNKNSFQTALSNEKIGAFIQGLPGAMARSQEVDQMKITESAAPATVTAKMIPTLVTRLPFCARRMLDSLEQHRHLKHSARLQLSLFLKDIKMPVDEQLRYWSARWSDHKAFDREHTYTIRYQYGLEGKRQERTMYGCRTMLSNSFPVAGASEPHGCPYRELKEPQLKQMLNRYGVTKITDVEEIGAFAKNNEYQRACQTTFTVLHPGHNGNGMGNHPVQYYNESCNYCASRGK